MAVWHRRLAEEARFPPPPASGDPMRGPTADEPETDDSHPGGAESDPERLSKRVLTVAMIWMFAAVVLFFLPATPVGS